jgi:hypothetical protein
MGTLGQRLLDGRGLPSDAAEGERWLRRAAEAGLTIAMGTLGQRLLDGRGLLADATSGIVWLTKAAEAGHVPAMITLGEVLTCGAPDVPRDAAAGAMWLSKAASAPGCDFGRLGFAYYKCNCPREAASSFLRALASDRDEPGNNLAYMLRRREVPIDLPTPPVMELLGPPVDRNFNFAELNLALCLASGFHMPVDWRRADDIVRSLQAPGDLVEWWRPLAQKGEGEGHLVLGWLARHSLVPDPDDWTVAQRLQAARDAGWDVPDWMFQPTA